MDNIIYKQTRAYNTQHDIIKQLNEIAIKNNVNEILYNNGMVYCFNEKEKVFTTWFTEQRSIEFGTLISTVYGYDDYLRAYIDKNFKLRIFIAIVEEQKDLYGNVTKKKRFELIDEKQLISEDVMIFLNALYINTELKMNILFPSLNELNLTLTEYDLDYIEEMKAELLEKEELEDF